MAWYMNFCAPFLPNDPTINFHRHLQAALLALYTLAYALLHFYYKFWGPALPEERDSVKCNHRSTQPSASKTRRRASLSQSTVLNSPLRSRRRCQSR